MVIAVLVKPEDQVTLINLGEGEKLSGLQPVLDSDEE